MNKKKKIYADHAATTRLSQKALDAMMPYLENLYQNPSTLYSSARIPRKAIKESRNMIAEAIGALPEEVIFTSGGTESDNWAIKNILFSKDFNRKKIITTQIEHHAVLNSCKILEQLGYQIIYLPVDGTGIVSVDTLEQKIDNETALVSIIYANNEIGTIQHIKELAEITQKYGALFHTDAVQAIGHIPLDVKELGIDMMSASAHKFNGPKGIGFLYLKKGVELNPFITGGSQESGSRAGTENVASIVGMAEALKENIANIDRNIKYISLLESRLIDRLSQTDLDFRINGAIKKIPGNISLSFSGIDGEVLLHRLDLKGIEVATGSACDSSITRISHVIEAIGVPEKYARGTIRISLGIENTLEDVGKIADELEAILISL